MALKVTALTYISVIKSLNIGQKRLYDLFLDIAGPEIEASITKEQLRKYLLNKFNMTASDEELDEFFKFAKRGSTDTDPTRITSIEYYMNVHAFPIDPIFENPLIKKIAALDQKTIQEVDAWMKRIRSVLEVAKNAKVNSFSHLGISHD